MTVQRLAASLARGGRAAVLIDGPSGSGKTSLAARLRSAWPRPVAVVAMDDLYPGWAGLEAGARMVASHVLRSVEPGYVRWDWAAGAPGAWVPLDPASDLIVEGCGALTPANRALASAGVWLPGGDRGARRARGLARSGETYRPHWDSWAAQEEEHWAAHRPWLLADVWVGDGRVRRVTADHPAPRIAR